MCRMHVLLGGSRIPPGDFWEKSRNVKKPKKYDWEQASQVQAYIDNMQLNE